MPIIYLAKPGQEQPFFCDITPRNLQKLKVKQGDAFTYRIMDIEGQKPREVSDFAKYVNGDAVKDKYKNAGTIKADEHNLLLIPNVPIDQEGCVVEVKKK